MTPTNTSAKPRRAVASMQWMRRGYMVVHTRQVKWGLLPDWFWSCRLHSIGDSVVWLFNMFHSKWKVLWICTCTTSYCYVYTSVPKCHSEMLCYHRYITVYIYISHYITKTPQPKSHTRKPWTASNSPAEELESQEGETAVACGSCECRSRSSLIWLKTRNLQRHRFCAGHVRSGENLNVRHVWSVVTEMRCFKCGRTSSHLAFDG